MKETDDYYDFSFIEEQLQEKEHAELVDLCQIPEEKLESISTKGLIVSCLDYPYGLDFMFYDSYRTGYSVVKSHFNGLTELSVRNDAAEILTGLYCASDLDYVLDSDEFPVLRYEYFELILQDDAILAQMTHEMRAQIIRKCMENLVSYHRQYSGKEFSDSTTVILISKTMYLDNEEFQQVVDKDEGFSAFLKGDAAGVLATSLTDANVDKILEIASKYY